MTQTTATTAHLAALAARRRLPAVLGSSVLFAMAFAATWVQALYRAQPREFESYAQYRDRGVQIVTLSIGALVLGVVAIVVWIVWFVAVYDVARALGGARYPRVWAVLAWLIPVANLFVPKQLLNDAWRTGGRQPVPFAVQAWWVLWVLVAARLPLLVAARAMADQRRLLATTVVALTIAMAVLWMRTAQVLTRRVELAADRAAGVTGDTVP